MPSKNAEIAVLQTQVTGLVTSVAHIETKVDRLLDRFETTAGSFASKAEVKELVQQISEEFDNKISDARKFNWLTHSMTAILTAFLIAIAYWIISQLVSK